ncbi:sensor histidine kinase [Pseudoalteromonas sp. NEC-BIFX-2020_002]|uniref:sensor histidine kinase n=1 Tax=Pseudoalteromonas sp. NEC-BIFX-2020_002 TaxID=2732353 RepID=UPI001476F62D|nr:sensor histidine kinase [Pseudoalteromonas sp. NEC-BIFX-2020_002]NNG41388.1 sensor histidine kinase [Pseudoalteromonas sp. NEC-BIFX-2020_002]
MNRKILWKLCLILATGLVAFFYLLHALTLKTEESMSFIAEQHREQLKQWSKQAEQLYLSDQHENLVQWLENLQAQEQTWVSVASFNAVHIAGEQIEKDIVGGYHFGRSIDWKIHLYFEVNPIMELPFSQTNASLLIKLPERMRPGTYWLTIKFILQVLMPMAVLVVLSVILYRHIITPLQQLDKATSAFSKGNFKVRVGKHLGHRKDELSHLASTFDQMASQIGELIASQRQLISDLSHELRTPLTRLDIAVNSFDLNNAQQHLGRITRESHHIRKLVEDTLTLAWLENEKPIIKQEDVDLVDLLDVLVEDAKFEFPDRRIIVESPNNAVVNNSSHRALCPAIENIIRNALRFTPSGKLVQIKIAKEATHYSIEVIDQGPGIEEQYLQRVFDPFFRIDNSRMAENDSFGLGLALAKRHLASVRADVRSENQSQGGLKVLIMIPIS